MKTVLYCTAETKVAVSGARKPRHQRLHPRSGSRRHAGRNPDDGRNAIVAASDLAVRLFAAKEEGLAVNPARIEGGGPNNVVPDLAILRINFRPSSPDAIARAQAAIDGAVADIAAARDVRIEAHVLRDSLRTRLNAGVAAAYRGRGTFRKGPCVRPALAILQIDFVS